MITTCHNVFNVWPKATLLLPVWRRDTKRLDTLEKGPFACGAARAQRRVPPVSASPGPGPEPGPEEATKKRTKPKVRNLKGLICTLKRVLIRYKLVILLTQPLCSHRLLRDEASP